MGPWHLRAPLVAAAMMAAMAYHPAAAAPIDPNDPALQPFVIQQGDFSTVSLNYAGAFTSVDTVVKSTDIQVWVLDNANTNNGAGIDAAYKSPTGTPTNPPSEYYFQPGLTATDGAGCTPSCNTFPDPGGAGQFTGDTAVTWDANITDLNTALNGESAVFYFFMNEVGQGTDILFPGTDELAWAKVTLHDNDGVLPDEIFYLTNDMALTLANGAPDPTLGTCNVDPGQPYSGNPADCGNNVASSDPTINQNGTDFADNADERYTYVSGFFCTSSTGVLLHYGRCDSQTDPAGSVDIENNLGNNQAGFAVYNAELSAIIANNGCVTGGCYDVLQGEVLLSMTDNGFESIGIAGNGTTPVINPNCSPTAPCDVPEPGSPAMLGAGLIALSGAMWWQRRRRRDEL